VTSVDVLVPNYQYGGYLRACVTSVLSQNVENLRVLIIDNASTDDSVEVANQLACEDRRVQVLARRSNLGPHASYNEGIDWAHADYFLILDADDLLAPGSLNRALSAMESDPEISFTHGVEARLLSDEVICVPPQVTGEGRWHISTGRQFIDALCRMPVNRIGATTVVRRTSVQKRIGYYRPELRYTDDLEMWLRLATAGKVAEIMTIQGIRRIHSAQMSIYYTSEQTRDFVQRVAAFESFFAREGKLFPDARRLRSNARRGLGAHAYWSAISHICRGHWRNGLGLAKFAFTHRPAAILFPPVGWLIKRDNTYARIADVLGFTIAERRIPH
jgi:glycosyltransferase involved in cell wall biosynthesis